jgi:hypothetical protein
MTNNKLNAALVWKQMEDLLAPQLNFSVIDRAVYSHLFRHSRLERKHRFRFSMSWLAGRMRLLERGCQAHHVVYVRLPHEVRALQAAEAATRGSARSSGAVSFAETDFLRTRALRRSIHTREGGRCFYCLRRLIDQRRCLDHVVPQANLGNNSYRNLVSCCLDCNSNKAARHAVEFVRSLYRDRRLSSDELTGRLRALDELAAGKLKPVLPGQPWVAGERQPHPARPPAGGK